MTIKSPTPPQTDIEPHQLLGRLQATWLSLDYVLRLALIHKRGFTPNTVQSERIFAIHPTETVVDKLLALYSTDEPPLSDKLNKLSADRIKELARKTRHHLHALWTQDPASGQWILHHIGKTNWQNPIPINPQTLQALITEIEETTDAIVALTMSKP